MGFAMSQPSPAVWPEGCDLVAASGDKLFGGPQCGILVGRAEWVDRVRSSPLYRAFRADKLNLAALEATLIQYLYGDPESVPVVRMLRTTEEAIRRRCEDIAAAVDHADLVLAVTAVKSVIGGGTAPKSTLSSYALALKHAELECFIAPRCPATARRRPSSAASKKIACFWTCARSSRSSTNS